MMRRIFILLLIPFFCIPLFGQEKETLVLIDTNVGKIKVKLYNDTPLHRENFMKNVLEGKYDGALFHRVVKQFMIQGGDFNSVGAAAETPLGEDQLDYTIPAEIIYPKYFHKRGALCAARTPDEENPEKASSPAQFYIVTGKYFTELELDKMEKEKNITLTPEQKEAYMLKGGTPHLDGEYTVFGEVVSGIKVAEKIELVKTGEKDRPEKDVHIKSVQIVDK